MPEQLEVVGGFAILAGIALGWHYVSFNWHEAQQTLKRTVAGRWVFRLCVAAPAAVSLFVLLRTDYGGLSIADTLFAALGAVILLGVMYFLLALVVITILIWRADTWG